MAYTPSNVLKNLDAENNIAKACMIAFGGNVTLENMAMYYPMYEADNTYTAVLQAIEAYMATMVQQNNGDVLATALKLIANITGASTTQHHTDLLNGYSAQGISTWGALYVHWITSETDEIATVLKNQIPARTQALFADESAPTITSSALPPAITENSGAGKVIYTAASTDASTVTYRLDTSFGDAAYLSIKDAKSGEVYLNSNPDYETKKYYSFKIIATDSAGNASAKTVVVSVINVASEVVSADTTAPVFTSASTAEAIAENSGAGKPIYTATATDMNTVTYSLKPSVGDASLFSINTSTGVVYLTANPNYEAKSSYTFTVVAKDLALNSSEKAVTLAITDVANEVVDTTAPVFTSSAIATPLEEKSGANQTVYTAIATDDSTVTYTLKEQPFVSNPFTIETSTGVVKLIADPDASIESSYSFTVIAADASGNAKEQAVTLEITSTTPPEARLILPVSNAPVQLEATGNTTRPDGAQQIVSVGSAGDYVVVWSGFDSDFDLSIFVQKFNASGVKTGSTVKLEATGNSLNNDTVPQVAAVGTSGAYAVTWTGVATDGDNSIFVQMFNADGSTGGNVPVKLEALTSTPNNNNNPEIATLTSGFVVAWSGVDAGGDNSIFVQKFNSDGTVGTNARVMLEAIGKTNGSDVTPKVTAVGTTGEYAVAWTGTDSGGDNSIFVQKFSSSGATSGLMVQLEASDATNKSDILPQITALGATGAYVVTWTGGDADGDNSIFVQKFNANGTKSGSTVKLEAISSTLQGDVNSQVAAVGTSGEYVVAWCGKESSGDNSVFVQKFNADGTIGTNKQVMLEAIGNTTGSDLLPQITAAGTAGAFVVAWHGQDTEGDNSIFVQKFNPDGTIGSNLPVKLEAIGKTTASDETVQISAVGTAGEYAVAWSGIDSANDYSIFVQKFSADGFINFDLSAHSTKTGVAYLVNNNVAVTNIASITGSADSLWNEAQIATANSYVAISTVGLSSGTYDLYTSDSLGQLSAMATSHFTIA